MENKFDKYAYNQSYIKQNYKKFACELKREEWEELDSIIKSKGMNKSQFVRWAYNELKAKNN